MPRGTGPVAAAHPADLHLQLLRLQGAIGNHAVGDLARSGLFDRAGPMRRPAAVGPPAADSAPQDGRVDRREAVRDRESSPAEAAEPGPQFAEGRVPPVPEPRKGGPTMQHARASTIGRQAATGIVQRDWIDDAGDKLSGVADTASSVAGGVADAVTGAAGKAVHAVSGLAAGAADAVAGALDGVTGRLHAAFDAVVGEIGGVWTSVRTGATAAVNGVVAQASGLLGRFGALFSSIGGALENLDAGALRGAWAAITGTASSALATAQALAGRVTATIDGLWSALQGLSKRVIGGLRSQAEALIDRLPGPVQGAARSVWQSIEARATSAWQAIEGAWKPLRAAAVARIEKVMAKVTAVADGLKTSAIGTIVATIEKVQGFMGFAKQAMANPEGLIQPLVQEIMRRLQGMPDRAKGEAQTRVQAQAGGGAAASPGPAAAPVRRRIQRDAAAAGHPRSTLGAGDVLGGVWKVIVDKLADLWANLGKTVKDMVLGIIDPRQIASGLKQDWAEMTKDLSTHAKRIESVRTDSWDTFWEDLRRWISNLVDFPLIVWRTVNAMLGRLSVYIGLATILGGAVLGAIAGGTGGAVFGSVVPVAGTAGGGAAGIAAGAWAGAQAGYALSETIGLVLLVSFVAAEAISVQKALNDLMWVPQDKVEQDEDFNQVADSVIAVSTALVLMGIAFVGVALAKRVWAFVKNLPKRLFGPKVVDAEPPTTKPVEITSNKRELVICRACDPVPNVPKDLMAKRAGLTDTARNRLDLEANKIFSDPLHPKQAEFDSLRGFMNAMEKKGGTLEQGLQKLIESDAKKKAPPAEPKPKPPFGPAIADLPSLRADLELRLAQVDEVAKVHPDNPTVDRFRKRVQSQIDGPLKRMENGVEEANSSTISKVKADMRGVDGELAAAKEAPRGTEFSTELQTDEQVRAGKNENIEVDQKLPDGTFKEVKNTDPFPVEHPQFAKLVKKVNDLLTLARDHPVGGKPRPVVIEFRRGIDRTVAERLRAIELEGRRATIVGNEVTAQPLKVD